MRIRDRLIKGTLLNFIAMAFNQGSTLLINILVARILLKQVFGEYAMVYNTILTAATLAQLATGYTATKYVAEFRNSDSEKARRIMGLCSLTAIMMASIATIALLIFAPWISENMLLAPHLGYSLKIGAFFLFFSAVNGYQTGALAGMEAFSSLAKAGTASGIAAISAIAGGAVAGGLNGSLVGLSLSGLLRCLFHYFYLRSKANQLSLQPIYFEGFSRERSIIFKFALPAAIIGYFSMPVVWYVNAILARQPDGYGEMALFASSSTLRMLVLFVPSVTSSVSSVILNNVQGSDNKKNYGKIFRTNILINFSIVVGSAIFVSFFGSRILGIFGKDFSQGEPVLRILMFAAVFEAVSVALYHHIQVLGKIWQTFFFIVIPQSLVTVVAGTILIPKYKALGLGMTSAVSMLTCMLTTYVVVLYYKNSRINMCNAEVSDV